LALVFIAPSLLAESSTHSQRKGDVYLLAILQGRYNGIRHFVGRTLPAQVGGTDLAFAQDGFDGPEEALGRLGLAHRFQ
jgi:hypothetical protein